MPIERINYGSAPDDGTGDPLRIAFKKTDGNFVDLDNRKAEQTDVADALAGKVDKVAGKQLSTEDFTTAEKNKLNGVEAGANNFRLPAGTNGQVLKHNGTTWVAGTDNNTTYSVVTTSANGLMSAADKTKLDGVEAGANNFSLPAGANGQVLKHNGTNWVAGTDNNTTYSNMSQAEADAGTSTTGRVIQPTVLKAAILKHAPTPSDVTTSASGLMTAADKVKLNGIEAGATKDWTATAVASGADLNTYQTPGSYVCSSNATAATLLNCPTTKAFTMRVWLAAGCIQEIQEYHAGGGTGLRRWTRGYYGSGAWSDWDEVLTKRYMPTPEEVLPSASTNQILKFNGTAWVAAAETNTTYAAMSAAEANTGTATTSRVITAAVLKTAINTHAPVQTSVSGNAGTATKLATARTINGVSFDGPANITITAAANGGTSAACSGNAATATTLATARTINGTAFNGSANITTANWGTARNISIGGVAKSVNGSANVTWTAAEIGGVRSFTSVPTTNQGPEIIVTSPHLRVMVWNGTKYVRAPWHAPGQLSYFLRNIPTGYVEVRSDVVLNRADFPDLAEYLGVTATTFTLDETRGEFLRTLDSGRGKDAGRVVGSHQGDAGRNLTGGWYPSNASNEIALGGNGISYGAFTDLAEAAVGSVQLAGSLPANTKYGISLDASFQWPVANEFRVSNRAYRLAVTY